MNGDNGKKNTIDLSERLEEESKGNIINIAVLNPYTGPGDKPETRLMKARNLKKQKLQD